MRQKIHFLLGCILLYTGSIPMIAHGDFHQRVQRINAQIAEKPEELSLYLQRALLYQSHEDYDLAYADFVRIGQLDADFETLDFLYADLFAKSQRPQAGLAHIQYFLSKYPQHIKGLLVRSQLYEQLEQFDHALIDYSQALQYMSAPKPKHYLKIAKLNLYTDSTAYEAALQWLAEGQSKLGNLIALQDYAIELEVERGQYTAAIQKIDHLLKELVRKDKWLVRKAEVLALNQQSSLALATYREALIAIDQLPFRYQQTEMVKHLKINVQEAIIELSMENGK